jgi:amidase
MTISNGLAMSWEEWHRHDSIALADLVRAGKVTAKELCAQVAAGVARIDRQIEAVLGIYGDVVGDPGRDGPSKEGRLFGVPILLKNLGLGLAGRTQESSSKLFKDHVVEATDPLVENYLRAGLIPIGRSTTPEFGMTFDTATDYLGRVKVTRNPWKLERTPGGSSGGSAAAVAAGVLPISMSSDGGGSPRIPASFCGLVGLKATRGRGPRPLAQSEYILRIAIDGVVTRTVRDTAAAYDYLTRVPNGGSFIRMRPPARSYLEAIERDPGRLKIGLSTGMWGRATATDPTVAERLRTVATLLEGLGHHLEEIADQSICDWQSLWSAYCISSLCGRPIVSTGSAAGPQFATMAQRRGLVPKQLQHFLGPKRTATILPPSATTNSIFGR